MSKKRQDKQYSKEYKEETVALAREQGYSFPEAATPLGVLVKLHRTHFLVNFQS